MRTAAAFICIGMFAAMGFHKKQRIKKRVRILKGICLFLKLLRPKAEYLREPLCLSVSELSEYSELSELGFLRECRELCEQGKDFPIAWERAVNGFQPILKEELSLLLTMERSLSAARDDSLSAVLNYYEESFSVLCKQTEETADCDGRLYVSVFSSIGMLLWIILI